MWISRLHRSIQLSVFGFDTFRFPAQPKIVISATAHINRWENLWTLCENHSGANNLLIKIGGFRDTMKWWHVKILQIHFGKLRSEAFLFSKKKIMDKTSVSASRYGCEKVWELCKQKICTHHRLIKSFLIYFHVGLGYLRLREKWCQMKIFYCCAIESDGVFLDRLSLFSKCTIQCVERNHILLQILY